MILMLIQVVESYRIELVNEVMNLGVIKKKPKRFLT